MKRLIQIHHQNKIDRNKTVFLAQVEGDNDKQIKDWIKDVQTRFPCPDGYEYMLCFEASQYFTKTTNKLVNNK